MMNRHCYKKFILLLGLFSPLIGWSQNLVPNASFEEGPAQCGFTRQPELFDLPHWSLPTPGTTDIFSTQLSNSICWAHAPKSSTTNNFSPAIGHQFPRSGNRFIGIISMELAKPESNYREYLQAKLDQPLSIGESYCAEMYVSLAEQPKYASNNLGFLFTNEKISLQESRSLVASTPHVYERSVITDSLSWSRIAGIFTADSAYRYVTIGGFFSFADTKVMDKGGSSPNSWSYRTSYYFVDDVSVAKTDRQRYAGDTVICQGSSTTLEALVKWDSLRWSTLSQPALLISKTDRITISPVSTTAYVVKGKVCNTWVSDTITIHVKPGGKIDLGSDTVLCRGETLILRAQQGFHGYTWSDGSVGQSLVVTQSGGYQLTGQNANGCESSAEIKVSFIDAPVVNLGKDSLACEPYPLNAKGENLGNLVFEWSNGATDSLLLPSKSGVYWVTVKNQCGQSSDTITIDSYQDIFVPNVVTPNNDGLNERLIIEGFEARPLPSLTIYDSWGLQIYSKDNYDGEWPDHRILPGVYYFSVRHGNCRTKKGWVQVLK